MDVVQFLESVLKNDEMVEELTELLPGLKREDMEKILLKLIDIEKRINISIYEVFIDGASSGNPGPSSIGIVVRKGGIVKEKVSEYIGIATNNQAEYMACLNALKLMRQLGVKSFDINSDSELLIKQLNGEYRVKDRELLGYFNEIKELERHFLKINYNHIPREKNIEADGLARDILKEHKFQEEKGDKHAS